MDVVLPIPVKVEAEDGSGHGIVWLDSHQGDKRNWWKNWTTFLTPILCTVVRILLYTLLPVALSLVEEVVLVDNLVPDQMARHLANTVNSGQLLTKIQSSCWLSHL